MSTEINCRSIPAACLIGPVGTSSPLRRSPGGPSRRGSLRRSGAFPSRSDARRPRGSTPGEPAGAPARGAISFSMAGFVGYCADRDAMGDLSPTGCASFGASGDSADVTAEQTSREGGFSAGCRITRPVRCEWMRLPRRWATGTACGRVHGPLRRRHVYTRPFPSMNDGPCCEMSVSCWWRNSPFPVRAGLFGISSGHGTDSLR
jgi:hypothetical protein